MNSQTIVATKSTVVALTDAAVDEAKKIESLLQNDESYEDLKRHCYKMIGLVKALGNQVEV